MGFGVGLGPHVWGAQGGEDREWIARGVNGRAFVEMEVH